MSAKALFVPGAGDYFTPADDRIAELPKGTRVAAQAVWNAIMSLLQADKTELTITDRMLNQCMWLKGYRDRFIQKGLQAISPNTFNKKTGKCSGGIGLIDRIRRRGRRTIVVVARLRGSETRTAPARKTGSVGNRISRPASAIVAPAEQIAEEIVVAAHIREPEAREGAAYRPTSLTPEDRAIVAQWKSGLAIGNRPDRVEPSTAELERRKAEELNAIAAHKAAAVADTTVAASPADP
jgi:hypothetical protein